MGNNFSTSINILRDTEKDFHYIPTPNGKQVANQIVNDFKKGIRSFNIVGTYGTGKSSFLLALEQSVRSKKRFFNLNFADAPKVDFIKVVGGYNSIIQTFADLLGVTSNRNKQENIFSEIFNSYYSLGKGNKLLFVLIDEFGKFLEYASQHNPEDELYFIQQLAEFCNNPKHNIIFITTVHQSFESYAFSLSGQQKQEWTKVKGRFREITFNEPVEQLLFLASEYISETVEAKAGKAVIERSLKLNINTKAFNFNKDFLNQIASKLYPLDILSANVLTLSLQRYGQNERSLFSFLESTDHTGLSKFNKRENPFYNLACVYEYLNFNFYSFLTSKYNPDFSAWSSIRSALEEVERAFDYSINDFSKVIKTIGLLNIFAASGSILDISFLDEYLNSSCGITNGKELIKKLEQKKIILFRGHSQRYILFEGTDLDIQTALIEAGNKISEVSDVTTLLNKYFEFAPVIAKHYSYTQGTPRFFEFKISEYPISEVPEGEIDGYINLIFNTKLKYVDLEKISENQKEAIIYGFYRNANEIKNLLFEIEKLQRVLEENKEDKVAKRELESIISHQKILLNHYILTNLYSKSPDVKWYWKGEVKSISDKKDFNKLLSQICHDVYNATPTFVNELVNKHKISASIHSAKRNYFKALANNWDKENLGFDDDKFPPEKTIFLSLLKENGISPIRDNNLEVPKVKRGSSFAKLWTLSEKFIASAKSEPKGLNEFVSILSKRPFKLKQGLIDFWIPTFLFLKRDDFALFGDSGYIPNLSDENLELLAKYPGNYSIKSFDIEGVKLDIFNSYRMFLNQSKETKFDNNSFIETIKPFLTFYKGLPEYSKQTNRLSSSAINIRKAISTSIDPEDTFFEAFPSALNFTINALQKDKRKLQEYTSTLQSSIRELRTCYDGLIQRFEDYICDEIVYEKLEFEDYKSKLQLRFKKVKKHLLLAEQKTFVQRIDSALDDKKGWLNSISQAVVGKPLDSFKDEDEILLYDRFKSMVIALDGLTNISRSDINEDKEEVIGVKIDSFFSAIAPKIIKIPKHKELEINEIKTQLKRKLTGDKTLNIAALVNLLKELLK
jgi:ribosomal protein S15P/S13E